MAPQGLVQLTNEMLAQQGDIFTTLSERRNPDRQNIKAIEKVFAKLAIRYHLLQIAGCGGDGSHIDFAGL